MHPQPLGSVKLKLIYCTLGLKRLILVGSFVEEIMGRDGKLRVYNIFEFIPYHWISFIKSDFRKQGTAIL
jgi:hypothetical protein